MLWYTMNRRPNLCVLSLLYDMYVPNVELNGKTLELVKREKYLGFFVTDSFYDDEYIKN